MKTRNIRRMMLVMVMAVATGASAQKNVLKAFEKTSESKDVIVNKRNNVRSHEPGAWSSDVTEFHIPNVKEARKHIARIEEAFTKDSKKGNVTYYTRMKALAENATAAEREAYKKIQVKCDHVSIPITIGIDPSYDAIVLRCQPGAPNMSRTVVAIEWKITPGYGCQGRLYEIRGKNESLWEEPSFNPNSFLPPYQVPVIEKRKDDIVTRMHFYRDTYDGKDNSENSALLLNMTEYLNTNWEKASESEQNMVKLILQDMAGRSKAKMHRDLINQCERSLKETKGVEREIVRRIELYIKDFRACTSLLQRNEVVEQVYKFVSTQVKNGMDTKTANEVYERLLQLKNSATSLLQRNRVAETIALLEK